METLTPAVRFQTDHMAGYISSGYHHGVEITEGTDSEGPITRPRCLNLEHYLTPRRPRGEFVPRHATPQAFSAQDETSVSLHVPEAQDWDITTAITYDLVSARVIRAQYAFSFGRPYDAFEALLSNYFPTPTEPYLRVDGDWFRPTISSGEFHTWPRDTKTADAASRLNWDWAPNDRLIQETTFELPIMITPVRPADWYVIHIVHPDECASFSANTTFHAHDFSLFGRDVAAGERVLATAWLIYDRLETLDDALTYYQEVTGEAV